MMQKREAIPILVTITITITIRVMHGLGNFGHR